MVLDLALGVLIAPPAILTAFFALELVVGLVPARLGPRPPRETRAVIVVPAHDEAEVIGETLAELKQAAGGVPIFVVADNCQDRTAEIARAQGVAVLERIDPERRGKGYALAAAARYLEADAPQVVIVLDADCRIDGTSLMSLIEATARSGLPSQGVNLLRPDRAASPMVQISTFAFLVKNLIRQRALQRLAGRAHLTGTGMALPFALFARFESVGADVVEDLAFGLSLARSGSPAQLVQQACVWSGSSSPAGTLTQRRRWEGGYLRTAMKQAPALFFHGIRHFDLRSLVSAFDLFVPPLALLAAIDLAGIAAGSALVALGASPGPLIVLFATMAFAFIALILVWAREGRSFVSAGVLARLPLYVLWKLPLYLSLGRRGAPKEWLRTGR